ncbi:YfcL family protein [Pseudobowmanella zhangzhouensis]|uniref:YfcL family protein n=1 Tax=Pseudobowmanella zhangzhouensis TaxID=1537679 RepID=UPI003620AF2B
MPLWSRAAMTSCLWYYLHGHFSLVVARCELDASLTITALQSAMQESLQQAFEKGELDGDDQQQVQRFWLGLQPA